MSATDPARPSGDSGPVRQYWNEPIAGNSLLTAVGQVDGDTGERLFWPL